MEANKVVGGAGGERSLELPALKRLGGLAGARPVIIVDTREKNPLIFERLKSRPDMLETGDYSIAGLEDLFSIERKTPDDLANCCTGKKRSCFENELQRLRSYEFRRILIVGTEEDIWRHRYHSLVTPRAVSATLGMIEARYCVPVVFCPSPRLAPRRIESWAFWFARECLLTANALLRASTYQGVNRSTNGEEVSNG